MFRGVDMENFICPICGSKEGCLQIGYTDGSAYTPYYCQKWNFYYSLSDAVLEADSETKNKLLNLAFEHLLRQPSYERNVKWHFYYEEDSSKAVNSPAQYVNLATSLQRYPGSFAEYAERVLLNLSVIFPEYGIPIDADTPQPWKYRRALFLSTKANMLDVLRILDSICELGYLKHYDRPSKPKPNHYCITADGWKRIDAISKQLNEIRQGFIAMSFSEETDTIRKAFRQAIQESGYTVRVIDEKEHNNQIVPEIFFEIERSKFVVVDVTYPNYGAYYEAGYAQALGKQVIICCRKSEFESKDRQKRPHFDISQKSMVVWQDESDLVTRLKKRIEATVR